MQQSQTTLEGDYPQENRMESEGNGGVCSISCGETERKDGVYNLIDKIVSHDNLNRAYKRVKSNKGSAGIDEMESGTTPWTFSYEQEVHYLPNKRRFIRTETCKTCAN